MFFVAARFMGLSAWSLCLLALTGQSAYWAFFGTWKSITPAEALHYLIGLDPLLALTRLPIETGLRLFYAMMTMEIAIVFWWLGVFFFLVAFAHRLFFR